MTSSICCQVCFCMSIIPATHFTGTVPRLSVLALSTGIGAFERPASSIPPAHESLKHFTDRKSRTECGGITKFPLGMEIPVFMRLLI
ncbi:hypothetical protein CEXT_778901 [Caerostris extrusa]|uniref:Secreted protein n=1 Tax=Caerostris extrusa TaxID=172846 RepID=A0AAV4XT12_CAEEX|nr:hypothetical protein CEXT_778901 [Caerostris extrusa]